MIFFLQNGAGATRNSQSIKVSSVRRLDEARIDIDFGNIESRESFVEKVRHLLKTSGQVRSYGCSVMGFCQVADGLQDAYIPYMVKPWDVAAGILLVEEAGGKVTSFYGESVSPFMSEKIGIVSNSLIHSDCVEALREDNYN